MAIYSYIFGVIVAFVSYVIYQKYTNVYSSIILKPVKRYDYIIVGAGTAGCVLASRLTEDPKTRVLLLEAGDHMGYFTKIPLTPTAAQLGPNDWAFRTTSQKYSSFGLWDQTQLIPRGKGLGGSGQINFLLHSLGFRQDYENWTRRGFRGWALEDLKPYFVKAFGSWKSELHSGHCSRDGHCPGAKAPMKLKQIDEQNELMQIFKQASSMKAGKHTVFMKATATIKDGVRHAAFDAYLKRALKRKNLHVMLNTQAVSIRFENKTASSLYILQDHRQLDNIFINKEIILSAGAIKTPQILMLSGIGPEKLIRRLRIKLVSNNPHVGKNLHDHMNVPIYVSVQKPVSVTLAKVFSFRTVWDYFWKSSVFHLLHPHVGKNLHDHMNVPIYVSVQKPVSVTLAKVFSFRTVWDYFWKSSGLLSFPPVAGVEYQNSSALILFTMGTASERLLRDLSNYHPKVFRETFPFHNDTSKEGFMFLATCLQPRSRGSVSLRDSSTSVPPVLDPNYLHHYWDVRCMVKAMRRAEDLVQTKPFKDIGARIHWPRPERCLSFWNYTRTDQTGVTPRRRRKTKPEYLKPSKETRPKELFKLKSPPDEYLECIIREVAVTGHHVGGTCAGGTVVDDQLRVKSVSGVRVMDASVLPSPLSLFPNSVLVAMAEKAADVIRNSNIQ